MTYVLRLLTGFLIGVALAIVLGGCAEADRPEAVAATVNGGPILVRQVQAALAVGSVPAEQSAQAARQALEQLIDEELLVRRALEAGLERDPQVQRALEAARRQALAKAYIDWAARPEGARDAGEVAAFYRMHPALFEQRRLYRLRELVVAVPPDMQDALAWVSSGSHDLEEVAAWLRKHRLPFHERSSTRAAEQVPMSILPQMLEMRDGQVVIASGAYETSVIQLVRSEAAPLDEKQAAPVIERFLANRKRLEILNTELRRLRELATIEYAGDFSLINASLK